MRFQFEVDGRPRTVTLERAGAALAVSLDGRPVELDVVGIGAGRYSVRLPASGRQHEVIVTPVGPDGTVQVAVSGADVLVSRRPAGRPGSASTGAAGSGPQQLVAPMPGKVVKLLVKAGDVVALRQGIVVVEAMKMENELRAGRAGVVREVLVVEGASVDRGAPLVVIG